MPSTYVVLYFIKGPAPSLEQREDAVRFGPHCRFRNSLYIAPDTPLGTLESCSAVAGLVPLCYARAFPEAVDIGEFYAGQFSRVPMAVTAGIETADEALARLGLPGQSASDEPTFPGIEPPALPARIRAAIDAPSGPVRRATNKGRGQPSENAEGNPEWQRNA